MRRMDNREPTRMKVKMFCVHSPRGECGEGCSFRGPLLTGTCKLLILNGGETGIRTLTPRMECVSCRFVVAGSAMCAMAAVAHCPPLPTASFSVRARFQQSICRDGTTQSWMIQTLFWVEIDRLVNAGPVRSQSCEGPRWFVEWLVT